MYKEMITKEQIEQKEKELNDLKKQFENQKSEIPKLIFKRYKCLPKVQVSQIIDWNKPYNEIPEIKGLRKIKVEEGIKILESDEEDKFLGEYKNKYNFFWCEQTKWDKLNNYGRWLGRGDVALWDAGWYDLLDSYAIGRVVYVKEDE